MLDCNVLLVVHLDKLLFAKGTVETDYVVGWWKNSRLPSFVIWVDLRSFPFVLQMTC